ncbi:MAG: PAS domain S-box protein [Actinomycetota bacterium]
MSRIDPMPPGSTSPLADLPSGEEDRSSPPDPVAPTAGRGLTESGDPYRLLFESNPNPMWVYDLQTLEFLAVNEAALQAYGYSRDEFLARTIKDIRPEEDVPGLMKRLAGEEGSLDVPSQWRHRKKDGTVVEVEVRSREIELGGRRCRLVLVNDVTERLAAEARLRDSEEMYRSLFENASDIVYTHDLEGRYTDLNEAAKRISGYDPEEVKAMSVFEFIAPEYHELVKRMIGRKVEAGQKRTQYEIEIVARDGHRVPLEIHSWLLYHDDEPVGVQGIARDISGRRAAEETLRRSEERYRAISDLISDYAYAVRVQDDGALVLEWITQSFTRDLGYTAEELNEMGLFSVIHPEDLPSVLAAIEELISTSERTVRDFRVIARSGEVIWGRFYSTISRDEEGKATYIYGAGQNITDRKASEDALREQQRVLEESEQRFRALIENSSEAVMLWDADSTITYVTPSTSRVLGYPEELLVGRSAYDSIHRDDQEAIRRAIDFALKNPGVNVRGTFRVMRSDGTWRWIEGVGKNLLDQPGVQAIVTTFRDVTERVNAEEELKRSLELLQQVDGERRALLARLVNAQEEERERIALDIHDESIQVMTAISMRLDVLERKMTDPALIEAARQLQDSVRRCIASLRELIFEVHPHALEQYGLVPALRQLLVKAEREVGLTHEVEDGLEGEPPSDVRLTVYRIVQEALTNVLKHARASGITLSLRSEDDGVRGTIHDDGVGFFPSEAEQPSAGHLGLAAMRARAETVGGRWSVASEPGAGTTVDFWVPLDPVGARSN